MNVSKINLILENCDVVTIPIEDVDYFSIDKISEFGVCTSEDNDFELRKYAENVKLIISPGGNRSHIPFGILDDRETKVFDRLTKFNDICQIELIADNGISQLYFVDWNGSDDFNNTYQKSCMDGEYLRILIDKTETLSEFLDIESE